MSEVKKFEERPIKVFIAQGMSGIPDEVVELRRNNIIEMVNKLYDGNVEILDQFHVPDEIPNENIANDKSARVYRLGRSIMNYLSLADIVIFEGESMSSPGCLVELAVCTNYNIPYMTEAKLRRMTSSITMDVNYPGFDIDGDNLSLEGIELSGQGGENG